MKKLRAIVVAMLTSFALIVIIAVVATVTATKKLEIVNLDQVESGLSSAEVNDLERYIWESLQRTEGFDEMKNEVKALIRPSSFVKTEKDNVRSFEFLVDVDEFRATYRVSFALYRQEGFYESPVIDCPEPEEMKYAETTCRGERTSALSVTVGKYLPYYLKSASGETVTVTKKTDDAGEYLDARVNNCENETKVPLITGEIEKWAESLGYRASDYRIKVTEVCDGEF